MKRSEMVNKLREIVLEHMNCDCCKTDEEMYSTMLNEIERAGMLAPNKTLYGWDKELYNQTVISNDINKWDDET